MKRFWIILVFFAVLSANDIYSQFSDKEFHTQWLTINTSVINKHDLPRAQELMDKYFEEVLDDLVKEGKLQSWGYLEDGLLEDGNFNIYYVTNTQLDFENFWGEYMKRNAENNPLQWSELINCFNMYEMVGQTNNLTYRPVPMR